MRVEGVSAISGVRGIPQIAPVSEIDPMNPASVLSSIGKNGATLSVNPTKGLGKTESVGVVLTVQTANDIRKEALKERMEQEAITLAHARFLRGTAKLAQKYNDNNAFMYDAKGNKHLFDSAGQIVDVRQ